MIKIKKIDYLIDKLNGYYDKGQIKFEIYSFLFDQLSNINESIDNETSNNIDNKNPYNSYRCAVSFFTTENNCMAAGTMIIKTLNPPDCQQGIIEIKQKLEQTTKSKTVAILNIEILKY